MDISTKIGLDEQWDEFEWATNARLPCVGRQKIFVPESAHGGVFFLGRRSISPEKR